MFFYSEIPTKGQKERVCYNILKVNCNGFPEAELVYTYPHLCGGLGITGALS